MNAKKEIKGIVLLLSCAIATGVLFAGLMLYRYSPSGRYIAGQTMMDPKVIDEINGNEGPKKKAGNRFLFDKTEFDYYDSKLGKMKRVAVSVEAYDHFYNLIRKDQSLADVEESILHRFYEPHLAKLITRMQTNGDTTSKLFQVIEVTRDGYYRVQLHQEQVQGDEWAYFYRKNLQNDLNDIFKSAQEL